MRGGSAFQRSVRVTFQSMAFFHLVQAPCWLRPTTLVKSYLIHSWLRSWICLRLTFPFLFLQRVSTRTKPAPPWATTPTRSFRCNQDLASSTAAWALHFLLVFTITPTWATFGSLESWYINSSRVCVTLNSSSKDFKGKRSFVFLEFGATPAISWGRRQPSIPKAPQWTRGLSKLSKLPYLGGQTCRLLSASCPVPVTEEVTSPWSCCWTPCPVSSLAFSEIISSLQDPSDSWHRLCGYCEVVLEGPDGWLVDPCVCVQECRRSGLADSTSMFIARENKVTEMVQSVLIPKSSLCRSEVTSPAEAFILNWS